ncbi:hypothetical protein ACQVP2_07335 [Methylobacterium aquaticum]|uniref:hypothetical protein n=1 Tax=Methylobacterium aquaticum TaxID=270351 RepID=UPI003D17F0F1
MLLTNPVPALEGLLALFEDGAEKGGTFVDQMMCHAAIDGLSDTILAFAELGARMEAAGLLEHHAIPLPEPDAPAGPLTPAERRQLARLAAPLDPEGRVVRLPTAATREAAR